MLGKKIIFFDIDGTIYQYGKKTMKSTVESVRKLKENGHIPVICTGRTKAMIFDEIFDMGFESLISGGGTYAEYKGKELYLYELEKEKAEKAVNLMKEYGFMPIPEGHRHMYIDEDNLVEPYIPVYKIYKKEIGDRIKNIDFGSMRISKISGVIQNGSDIASLEKELGSEYTFVNHAGNLLELIPKPYSKAVGIKRMTEYLGIPVEDTYAFGDSFNDLEMLTYVRFGVAMGNSSKELFEHVKYRTDSIDEDGIYNGLRRFNLI